MARKKHLRAGSEAHITLGENHHPNPNSIECAPLTSQVCGQSPREVTGQDVMQFPAPGHFPVNNPVTNECGNGKLMAPNPITGNGVMHRSSPVVTSAVPQFWSNNAMQFQNPSFCSPIPPGSPQVAITVPKTNQALNNMHLFRVGQTDLLRVPNLVIGFCVTWIRFCILPPKDRSSFGVFHYFLMHT